MPPRMLTLEVADRIATITLNRPDKLNALNDAMIGELGGAVDDVRERQDIGGVIVTGAGRAFAAGADIGELAAQDPASALMRSQRGQAVFRSLEKLGKPVAAAVNGFALGGGCELALACHVRIAGEAAQFAQPEVGLGVLPGYGGTQRLPRLVGKGMALQMLLTGERISARDALRIGLVSAVVPGTELMEAARHLVGRMLANAPLALAACIDAVDRGLGAPLGDALTIEAMHFGLLAGTRDMKEGMAAFLEKRAPRFEGR